MRSKTEYRDTNYRSSLRRPLRRKKSLTRIKRTSAARSEGGTYLGRRPIGTEASNHFRIQLALGHLYSFQENFRRVAWQNRDLALSNDLAVVDLVIDIMDSTARDFLAGREGPGPRGKAGELRQKRGMNIQDPTRKRFQHWGFQNAHEAGENDNFHSRLLQHSHQLAFGLWVQPSP